MIFLFIITLCIGIFCRLAEAGSTLSSDPQPGVTHYRVTWTSEDPSRVDISAADENGAMNHYISWLPIGIHKGYAQAGKEWKIRQGPAADQLGQWVPQLVYTWSDPTYFEINGGHSQPPANVYAIEDAP